MSGETRLHRSEYGTYHPDPKSDIAWTVNDTRGYLDAGPSCDECGACECDPCEECGHGGSGEHGDAPEDCKCCESHECIGLSFTYCCLGGGETLCEECFEKGGAVQVVACDCE